MKKAIISILLILSSIILPAQDYTTTIGVKILPGIATIYNPLVNENYARISVSEGLEIRQRLFRDLIFMEFGVYLFERGFKLNRSYTNLSGILVESKSKEIQNYLTVPISIILKFGRFYSGVGANANYYLNRRFYHNGKLVSTDKSYQQKDVLYGVQLFVGYEFKIDNNFFITLETFVNPTIDVRFLNYGLGIGLKYSIKKNKPSRRKY